MHHLPEDIVLDVFLRLPTKPLLKFRCLSQQWNHLISDHFMKSRSRRMILLSFQPLHAMDYTIDNAIFELNTPFKIPRKDVIIVGTFNGIVVLVLEDDMILYNPFTRAFKTVPNPPFEPSYSDSEGFGIYYDTTPDDLKIVRLRDHEDDNSDSDDSDTIIWCDVFSLKKGTWSTHSRRLDETFSIKQHAGTFVNGSLYWLACDGLIVALDVKEMVFYFLELPCPTGFNILGTSGGRLYVFDTYDEEFNLWVLNEHDNNEDSWSNVLTSTGLGVLYHPMWILEEGKIVILRYVCETKVIIYDMLKHWYESYKVDFKFNRIGGNKNLQAVEYVESLISPSKLFTSW